MGIAISAAFILPDLPHNTRGFTKEELELAQLRMTEDVGESDTDSEGQGAFDGLVMALKDTKMYILMMTLTAYVVGLSFNAFFVSSHCQSPPLVPRGSKSCCSLLSPKHSASAMCLLCS